MNNTISEKELAEEALNDVASTLKITDLPNEALVRIMDFLSFKDLFSVEGVNKRMRTAALATWSKKTELSQDAVNKNQLDVIEFKLTDRSLKSFFERMPNLKICHLMTPEDQALTLHITPLLSSVPKLTELFLNNIEIDNQNLVDIANFCPLLTNLMLDQCRSEIEDGMTALFQSCTYLKYLSLDNAQFFDGDCFEHAPVELAYVFLGWSVGVPAYNLIHLGRRCSKLETLIVTVGHAPEAIDSWMPRFRNLKRLALNFCLFESSWVFTLNFSVLPNLETFSINAQGTNFNNGSFTGLANCKKLKALKLTHVRPISNILSSLENLTSVKWVQINNCEFFDPTDFINHMGLEYVGFTYRYGLFFATLPFYAEMAEMVMLECQTLRYLELEYTPKVAEIFERHHEPDRIPKLEVAVINWPKDVPQVTCSWIDVICCHDTYYYKFTEVVEFE